MKLKQRQAKKIMDAIRQVLLADWDPIGIQGAGPDDEYDFCIGPLYHLLIQKPTEDEVMDLLYSFEGDAMGFASDNKENLRAAARKLLALDLSSDGV